VQALRDPGHRRHRHALALLKVTVITSDVDDRQRIADHLGAPVIVVALWGRHSRFWCG
jgi:hypothetical protein